MLLELNKEFYGFTPVSRIDNGAELYREVYHATVNGGPDVMLIVYARDIMALDAAAPVEEFKLRHMLKKEVFPSPSPCRRVNHGGHFLEFMTLPWLDCRSLREYVSSEGVLRWDLALPLFHTVLHGAHEISVATGGGGHYGFNPDNIYITVDDEGVLHPIICGLTRAGAPSDAGEPSEVNGDASFYCAPETYEGVYSRRSDVFSLTLVLLYMLQGEYPFKERFDPAGMNAVDFEAKYVDMLSSRSPRIDILGGFKTVVASCLSVAPARRLDSVAALAAHVGAIIERDGMKPYVPLEKESQEDDEQQDRERDNDSEGDRDPVKPERRGDNDRDDSQRPRGRREDERKANVEIARVDGNGFKDVAGMEELKSKFTRNFISIVQNPELAKVFDIAPPNGMLLWGPPGNGKTFISRKLAEESGLLFAVVNPSDLGSIYIHGTQGLIGDLFARCEKMAKKENTGVLLCLEEFDTLVPNRAAQGVNNRNDEVAEFLTRLNNCADKGVYVIATTNRIDAIDPAIMRKGRMDEVYYVGLPDAKVRKSLFELEIGKRPHDNLDLDRLAELTDGYSSGDISFLVKEAARKSFEATLATPTHEVVGIAQTLLETTIKEHPSSVTSAERHSYEKLRDSYEKNRQAAPAVGFKTIPNN